MGETQCKCREDCGGADPTSDTVKVDNKLISGFGKENEIPKNSQRKSEDAAKEKEQQRAREEQERERKEKEAAAAAARQAAEAAAKQAAERQAAEERERAARVEQERQQAAAAKAKEEEAARQRRAQQEEAEKKAAEDLRRAEEEKARQQKEEQEAIKAKERATVDTWLSKNGFAGINTPKKSMFKTNYPLHVAVTKGEAEIVGCLCRCGADKTVKNSSKQTPLELAQKNNKKGSPDALACATALSDNQSQ